MKTIYLSILVVALSLITSTASAENIFIGGICYKLNSQTHEATIAPSIKEDYSDTPLPRLPESVVIPSEIKHGNVTYKVTAIGRGAFSFQEITSIIIPNTITFIGDQAFFGCEKLSMITLPNSINSIGKYAFLGCSNLKSITIPEGVTLISESTFYNCSALVSVVIPSSVTFINTGAFYECKALKSITVKSPTPIDLFSDTFEVFGELHVPAGSKEAYSKAPIWKYFTIIEDEETTGIANIPSPTTHHPSPIFNLSGQSLTAPRKGINIINGKKMLVK